MNQFVGGEVTGNDNAFIVNSGSLIVLGMELGSVGQTNGFALCTNVTICSFTFIGGNAEIEFGALVATTNHGFVAVTISDMRAVAANGSTSSRLVDFGGDLTSIDSLVIYHSRNTLLKARIEASAWNSINLPSIRSLGQSSGVIAEWQGRITNNIGEYPETYGLNALAYDVNAHNSIRLLMNNSGTRDMHYFVTATNATKAPPWKLIPLEQYAYDVQDGFVARTGIGNTWAPAATKINGIGFLNGYDYGWGLDPNSSGRRVRFGMGQIGYDEWFISSASSHGGTPDHYNVYFDTAANAMTVYGTVTATGVITGNGSGLTNLNLATATGGGLTTNVTIGNSTFFITNGLIMRITTP